MELLNASMYIASHMPYSYKSHIAGNGYNLSYLCREQWIPSSERSNHRWCLQHHHFYVTFICMIDIVGIAKLAWYIIHVVSIANANDSLSFTRFEDILDNSHHTRATAITILIKSRLNHNVIIEETLIYTAVIVTLRNNP